MVGRPAGTVRVLAGIVRTRVRRGSRGWQLGRRRGAVGSRGSQAAVMATVRWLVGSPVAVGSPGTQ